MPKSPLFEPGYRLPARIDANAANALVAGQPVAVSADMLDGGPFLDGSSTSWTGTKAGGGNIVVDDAADGAKILGVIEDGGVAGDQVTVLCSPLVVESTAGLGGVTAGDVLEVAANKFVTLTAGEAVGIALNTAAADAAVIVKLL